MFKKSKIMLAGLAIAGLTILTAGCGSTEKQATKPPAAQQSATGHEGHSMTMPKEDPMPTMKDMDKALQDVVKQVKGGQMLDAQKSAAQLATTVEKVMPHMMDTGLKANLRKAANDIKGSVNSGKTEPGAIEEKAAAMQTIMKQTTTHLQSMSHS
ncbi:MAG: hypothetical protein AB9883_02550 [Acidaminococcaceae bacterium]